MPNERIVPSLEEDRRGGSSPSPNNPRKKKNNIKYKKKDERAPKRRYGFGFRGRFGFLGSVLSFLRSVPVRSPLFQQTQSHRANIACNERAGMGCRGGRDLLRGVRRKSDGYICFLGEEYSVESKYITAIVFL